MKCVHKALFSIMSNSQYALLRYPFHYHHELRDDIIKYCCGGLEKGLISERFLYVLLSLTQFFLTKYGKTSIFLFILPYQKDICFLARWLSKFVSFCQLDITQTLLEKGVSTEESHSSDWPGKMSVGAFSRVIIDIGKSKPL